MLTVQVRNDDTVAGAARLITRPFVSYISTSRRAAILSDRLRERLRSHFWVALPRAFSSFDALFDLRWSSAVCKLPAGGNASQLAFSNRVYPRLHHCREEHLPLQLPGTPSRNRENA